MNDTLTDKIRQAAAQSVKESGKAEKPLHAGAGRTISSSFFVMVSPKPTATACFRGWRNSPLTETGREQARALAPKLKELKLDVAVTSDQIRSRDTAHIALSEIPNIKWESDRRIKERNYGELAGQSKTEWMQRDPERTALTKHSRRADAVARYGGEEFILMLPETSIAAAMAERLRVSLNEVPIAVAGVPTPLTASIGVAGYPDHGQSQDELLRAVDAAMYEAKKMGRNRVHFAAV